MLSACRSISGAKVLEKGPEGYRVSLPSGFESGKCWGAFLVIQKLARKGDISLNRRYNVCAPADSHLVQLVAVFVNYAEQNPQRWHEDFFEVTLDSLQALFPCSRSG